VPNGSEGGGMVGELKGGGLGVHSLASSKRAEKHKPRLRESRWIAKQEIDQNVRAKEVMSIVVSGVQ
jgi:hypothetical protein